MEWLGMVIVKYSKAYQLILNPSGEFGLGKGA
jgi:hypothetical protein